MVLEVCRLLCSTCSITTSSWGLGGFDDSTIRHVFDYVFHEPSSQSCRRVVRFLCTLPYPYSRTSIHHHRSPHTSLLCILSADKEKRVGLVTSGPYGLVRHPQYLGIILATLGLTSWSVWILNNTYGIGFLSPSQTIGVWFIELLVYILLALIEELFLSRNYGRIFSDYKSQVPFLIPFLKTNRKDLDVLVSVIIPLILLFVLINVQI